MLILSEAQKVASTLDVLVTLMRTTGVKIQPKKNPVALWSNISGHSVVAVLNKPFWILEATYTTF